jgi:hypothetical protein
MQKSVQERNAQGEWVPAVPLKLAPTFVWPIKPAALLRYLFGYPGYFLPWGVFYMAFPIVTWMFFTPPLEDFKSFSIATALYVFVRNLILVTLVAGGFHYWHYVRRGQGTDYKYNGRWLAEDTPRFLFRNQTLDNVFWTVASAVPVWTAFELVTMWGCANGYLPYVSFSDHPIYCILIFLAVPILHEVHFYLTHRLIHIPVLYRTVHYLHHRNVNIGPFSGLAMHPVEHVIYWTGVIFQGPQWFRPHRATRWYRVGARQFFPLPPPQALRVQLWRRRQSAVGSLVRYLPRWHARGHRRHEGSPADRVRRSPLRRGRSRQA